MRIINTVNVSQLLIDSVKNNNIQEVQDLFDIVPDVYIHPDCMKIAAMQGNLSMLKLLFQHEGYWESYDIKNDEHLIDSVATQGHVDVIEWLIDNGCTYTYDIAHIAAQHGHLTLLEWAIDNNYVNWHYIKEYMQSYGCVEPYKSKCEDYLIDYLEGEKEMNS